MAQPVWVTAAGSLGVVPEGIFYQQSLLAYSTIVGSFVVGTFVIENVSDFGDIQVGDEIISPSVPATTVVTAINTVAKTITMDQAATATSLNETIGHSGGDLYYQVIAGSLPDGVQCTANGNIVGVPLAVASLQGVPTQVNQDVTSKFTVRVYTETLPRRIRDRTFTLTITGNDVPEFTTPAGSLGSYYDGDEINIQIGFTNNDPGDTVVVRLASGELPGGVTVTPEGLITGYIQPSANVDEPPGYDLTPIYTTPYDFVVSAISKNYQFVLEVTDGKSSNLRTFEFFVYDRATLTADNTEITADNTAVTADETTERKPFITNALPSNLGTIRGDNYYAHQFIGNDYDTPDIRYAIGVNQGAGLPPGLTLDPVTGWYYGYVPDQGVTEVEYSFNIVTYQATPVGTAISCTNTTFGTNIITCNDTTQINVGQPLLFTGTGFGGITAAPTTVYYVYSVVSTTEFTVATSLDAAAATTLTTAAGSMTANLIVASDPYPFTVTISGAVDAEVTWLTDADLGTIENGDTSLLQVEAVNRGGRVLSYRLKSGAFNELPQGLELLPSGEIAGRVSFNTFAVDLGYTTFDSNSTTWDSSFTFTVNAYAEDTAQVVYEVASITVTNGGSGYSSITPPVLEFSTPVGASAVQAQAGNVTVSGSVITAVEVADSGAGYSEPATITITEGFGGSNAVLTPVMRATGVKDVVSVFKTFTVRVVRAYNAPYQNLIVQAMPPQNDRDLINSLLNDENIFVPEYIFRPDDPNFGKATRVNYQHAYGLAPDSLDQYFASLYENHYWKNLVLGSIETAQAIDPVTGEVVYEVVYSKIVDNLVNDDGASVAKVVNLPYPIIDPADGSTVLTQVYPNSLVDMRNQVIDVVGQISTKLPLWMTSKQTNGRVLGFTPAWVICYTQPNRSRQIAYYMQTQFGTQLNNVDFKVDRYILDRELSKNWDTETQDWTPQPNLTTFDRFGSGNRPFLGYVSIATNLAFTDINNRTLEYIASLGGLDGQISQIDGNTLIFAKQQYYNDYTDNEAWQNYVTLYGTGDFDQGPTITQPTLEQQGFDESLTIPEGYEFECTETDSATDLIRVDSTVGMEIGFPIWFSGNTFGGIDATNGSTGLTQIYYVKSILGVTCTATAGTTELITCTSTADMKVGDAVWFSGTTFGNISELNDSLTPQIYYITGPTSGVPVVGDPISNPTQFTVSTVLGGTNTNLDTATGTMTVNLPYFSISETNGGATFALTTASGSMTTQYGNQRMAIYTINVDAETGFVTLTLDQMSAESQYVQIERGTQYVGQQLYYPTSPAQGFTLVNWLPVPAGQVDETTFDQGSMAFEEPVDMYDPTDAYDKYLVFPKSNILV